MPPFKTRVKCQDCPWGITGFHLNSYEKAIRHANKHNHTVDIFRSPGEKMTTINRQTRPGGTEW